MDSNTGKVEFECYNDQLIKSFDVLLSDTHYPNYYLPFNPIDAIKAKHKTIYLLSHPRHWRTAPLENTVDNIKRLWEGFNYR